MKYYHSFLFLFFCIALSCKKKGAEVDQIVRIPLKIVDGFGPFGYDAILLGDEYSEDDHEREPWNKMYSPVTGVPDAWKQVVKSTINLNIHQLVYQNYFAGKVSKDQYMSLQKSWKWLPDSTILSSKPIKCEIYVVRGKDEFGKMAMMIDSNNDRDFSNETKFYPAAVNNLHEMSQKKVTMVNYEVFRDGRVLTRQAPLIVVFPKYLRKAHWYLYCIPQYASGKLNHQGVEYEIAVRRGFTETAYSSPEIVLTDHSANAQKVQLGQGVNVGETITIGKFPNAAKYRFKGIDQLHDELILEGESVEKQEYSTQIGYHFKPFQAKEFNSTKVIRLVDFKGKYVFIDFWGTWCKPCVEELPELQEIFESVDKEKIVFISIAGHDSQARLKEFLERRPLPWLQILSDSSNKLLEMYGIQSFPTNFIIDPEGKVIVRNIHGDGLRKKLKELRVVKNQDVDL